MNEYAETITQIRETNQINKTEMARRLHVDPSLITLWEQGEREPGKAQIAPLLNLAMPEQQAALLRALIGDDNFEVLVHDDSPDSGLVLRRVQEAE